VVLTSFAHRRFSAQTMELASSELRYRQIVETALDAFVAVDEDGMITDWNRQAEVTFGWPHAEAIGRRLNDIAVPIRFRAEHKEIVANMVASSDERVARTRVETTRMHIAFAGLYATSPSASASSRS